MEDARRIKYELRPRTVIDLRHYGAVEIRVNLLHAAFLRALSQAMNSVELVGDLPIGFFAGFPLVLVNTARILWKKKHSPKLFIRRRAEYAFKKFLTDSKMYIRYSLCEELGEDVWQDTWDARRMGTGDIIIEMGMCQKIAKQLDGELLIVYDPVYPTCREIWANSGLSTLAVSGTDDVTKDMITAETGWPDYQRISYRGHMQESHLGGLPRFNYARKVGYPGALMLYELGWENEIDWKPVTFWLDCPDFAQKRANQILRGTLTPGAEYITLQPIERSRKNEHSTKELWTKSLSRMFEVAPSLRNAKILIGATKEEIPTLGQVLPRPLIEKAQIVCDNLLVWYALIRSSSLHITANNCGLWLGLCSGSDMWVIDGVKDTGRDDAAELAMWSPKPNWFGAENNGGRGIHIV